MIGKFGASALALGLIAGGAHAQSGPSPTTREPLPTMPAPAPPPPIRTEPVRPMDLGQTAVATPRSLERWSRRIADDVIYYREGPPREIRLGFTVVVDAMGRVASCTVNSTSGSSQMDEIFCRSMQRYARFNPARDRTGNPVPGEYSNFFRISAPPPEPQIDDMARVAQRAMADYPIEALKKDQQGTVSIRLAVSAEGKVTGCEVTRSSGHRILDESACNSMRRYAVFKPALESDGTPIESTYETSITYALP